MNDKTILSQPTSNILQYSVKHLEVLDSAVLPKEVINNSWKHNQNKWFAQQETKLKAQMKLPSNRSCRLRVKMLIME